MSKFGRYIGIDYSGAVTPESSCKGIRIMCSSKPPNEVLAELSTRLSASRERQSIIICVPGIRPLRGLQLNLLGYLS